MNEAPLTRKNSNFFITLDSFNKLLTKIGSKDIKSLVDLWVTKPGFARFNVTYAFNRKKNAIEIELKQDMINQKGYRKYVGPIAITIQEIDGSFTHNLHIEDVNMNFEIF
jgi:transcription initiation factor TFIID subunit 2